MAIKWAPLFVPLHRRLEFLAAFTFISIILFSEIASTILFGAIIYYGGVVGQTACFIYLVYVFIDRKALENCSRGQGYKFVRGSVLWKYFVNYFPSKLIKTVDIPADKNYIFACYPHGVISCGAFGHFVTDGSNYRELFPGIRSKLCTLNFHFFVPLFREIILGWGMMAATSKSIKIALSQPNDKNAPCNADGYTSNGIVLMVGGAQEALHARPGNYKIILKKRKGFVKLALQTGASLIPVFSFNEVEVFDQPSNEPGTKIRRFQDFVKKWTGIAPAFFIGRGFFQYSFGLIPQRHPIYTVIGEPLPPIKISTPTNDEIDEMHGKYVNALTKLFEDHKMKYLKNAATTKLIIE